ncbi:hypothetical protein [Arthrobacter sp.]
MSGLIISDIVLRDEQHNDPGRHTGGLPQQKPPLRHNTGIPQLA